MKIATTAVLSPQAQAWHDVLAAEYGITDAHGSLLLMTACEAFDRLRSCQGQISLDGEQIIDRFGQFKAHPLLAAERDARAQMLACLKALQLDVEPLEGHPGRPPGGV